MIGVLINVFSFKYFSYNDFSLQDIIKVQPILIGLMVL